MRRLRRAGVASVKRCAGRLRGHAAKPLRSPRRFWACSGKHSGVEVMLKHTKFDNAEMGRGRKAHGVPPSGGLFEMRSIPPEGGTPCLSHYIVRLLFLLMLCATLPLATTAQIVQLPQATAQETRPATAPAPVAPRVGVDESQPLAFTLFDVVKLA